MKTNYVGKLEPLSKEQQKNLDNHYAKLAKMVDRRGEREVHVMLTAERHLKKAELKMHYYGMQAVGSATHKDQFLALLAAVGKLEKQLHKMRDKWSDTKRKADNVNGKKTGTPALAKAPVAPAAKVVKPPRPKVRNAKVQKSLAPMSIGEAVLYIKPKSDYLLFEEAETKVRALLIRRPEGAFDLFELE
jgi:ribosomal subunit interface protein